MRILKNLIFASLLLSLFGCQVPSTVALGGRGGRNAFNTSLQMTSNEQMLLNLVRLRYCDTPYFLNVTNVTSQVSYETAANTKLLFPGFNEDNPATVGGGMTWKSQPTIVYSPLEGRQFSELLLKPIDLMFIQQLVYSGWDVDRVFKLTIQSFDNIYNAPTASGPFPNANPEYKEFYRVTELMRYFQKNNELHVGIKMIDPDSHNESASLQLYFPDKGEEAKELSTSLGLPAAENGYYIADMNLGFQDHGKTGVMPRSILSTMYYLSLGVDIPERHEMGDVGMTTMCQSAMSSDWQGIVRDLITVRHSRNEPRNAFLSVKYRGYWFYIDREDIASKRTFVLLLNLFNLQAGSTKTRAPILTLPVGV